MIETLELRSRVALGADPDPGSEGREEERTFSKLAVLWIRRRSRIRKELLPGPGAGSVTRGFRIRIWVHSQKK
jgi:hypothetical protein